MLAEPNTTIALIASTVKDLLRPSTPSHPHAPITRENNLQAFDRLLSSTFISDTDLMMFTDGGAAPNPGPCGAGAVICWSSNHREQILANPHASFYHALGTNDTNNAGELYALGMVTEIMEGFVDPLPSAVHIFPDSRFALGCALYCCRYERFTMAAHRLRLRLRALQCKFPIHFYWIAGHSNNQGGDAADRAATHGVNRSKHVSYHCTDFSSVVNYQCTAIPPTRDSCPRSGIG